jgi:hypothetical protein
MHSFYDLIPFAMLLISAALGYTLNRLLRPAVQSQEDREV